MQQARTTVACAVICMTWSCVAASTPELSEREFLTEFPTVLAASRLRQNVMDAPQAVTVIDRETIRASAVPEIPELFRMVPGFNVGYSTRVKGLQPIVSYHGMGGEFFSRLQVLIDGRSMNNATLGGVDWNDFPLALDDIERIEVVRGPSTASHGIGAFLGTINFVTRHPSQQRGGYASVNAGSDGILDLVARYAGATNGLDYRVTAGRQSDNGFMNVADRHVLDFASMRADWQIDRADSLMLQAGATNRSSDVGSATPADPKRTARFETAYAHLRWERNLDADNGYSAQIYYYRFALDDRFVTDPIRDFNNERFPIDEESTIGRVDLEVQQTFTAGADWRFVWGGSLREDSAEAPRILRQAERLRVARLFGHAEWRVTDTVIMNAGAMVEYNNLTTTDAAPQVSLNWRFARDQVLRFGASKALRTPTLFEEKVQNVIVISPPSGPIVISNSNLQPETIVSGEVGYVGEWPELHATLDLKLFCARLHNLIGLRNPGNEFPAPVFARTVVNGDDATQRGIEGQMTWQPAPGSSLTVSASHLDTRSTDRIASYSTSAPRDTAHLLLTHRFNDAWDASGAVHWQSSYRPIGVSEDQPAFSRVDVRVARNLALAWGQGEIGFVVENVFNEHYTSFRAEDVAQRRAWLTFRLKL
jgi:iron complex outermembrane recepter protein